MIVVVCPPFFGLYTGFKKNFNFLRRIILSFGFKSAVVTAVKVSGFRGLGVIPVLPAQVQIRHGMLAAQLTVHPDIHPDQQGDGYGADQTNLKQPSRIVLVKDRHHEGDQVQGGQQHHTGQSHDLPGSDFFSAFLRIFIAHVKTSFPYNI